MKCENSIESKKRSDDEYFENDVKPLIDKAKKQRSSLNSCKQFTTAGSVTIHKKSFHVKQKFPCDPCEYKATTQSNLTKHKQSIYGGIKYLCSKCDNQFTEKGHFSKHI